VDANEECEYCAQPPGRRMVVERPMESEVKVLATFLWVRDPKRLVFCDDDCRVKWYGLRRKAIWLQHSRTHSDDVGCMCVECMEG
jgi:hypothetical protein